MHGEQTILRHSIAATLAIAALGIVFGVLSGSFSIIFDGAYALIDALMSLLALLVARQIAQDGASARPHRRFRFGFWHLEPMVLALNGILLSTVAVYAFANAIGLILAGIVNMIWPSGTMSFIISAAGVLIFSGLIAYDTQKIKEQYAEAWGTDVQEKVAIFGALSLYLDFVNLFQFLMSFMGQNRD